MANETANLAAVQFPKLFAKLQKSRREVMSRPLTSAEVTTLLRMRFNGAPQFESPEIFLSDQYTEAAKSGMEYAELSKLPRYRPATAEEANLLYCDIHARDRANQYSRSSGSSDQG